MDVVLNHLCWKSNAKMALSTIVSHLKEFKVLVRTNTPSTFGWIFKQSKLYQTSPTTISRHSTHFIPNNRTEIAGCYLTIFHFINRQKVYFQYNFNFLPIQRKMANFNFQFDFWAIRSTMEQHLFTKSTVAFSSTKLTLQIFCRFNEKS